VIGGARHEYDVILLGGQGVQHKLRRSRYEIECVNCGLRTQTVEAQSNMTATLERL
jgi:hypothetical protein